MSAHDPHRHMVEGLEAAAAGEDLRKARRARITLAALVPFYQQVNRDIAAPSDDADDDINVLSDAGMCLASGLSFIIDHMVVRGMPRDRAKTAAMEHFEACLTLIERTREKRGYVPEPIPDPANPFDFRKLMKDEG